MRNFTMTGFREQNYAQSEDIMQKFMKAWYAHDLGSITSEDAGVLRECWTCSKSGNNLRRIVENVGWHTGNDPESILQQIIDLPGFLTKRERWYTQRIRLKTLLAYRGCEGADDLGFSWTLSRDVAAFFAGRIQNGQIVTARVAADAWLDTAEHEVIALSPNKQDILSVEAAREPGWMDRDFWENRPIILPTQNIIAPGPR